MSIQLVFVSRINAKLMFFWCPTNLGSFRFFFSDVLGQNFTKHVERTFVFDNVTTFKPWKYLGWFESFVDWLPRNKKTYGPLDDCFLFCFRSLPKKSRSANPLIGIIHSLIESQDTITQNPRPKKTFCIFSTQNINKIVFARCILDSGASEFNVM